MVLEKQFLVNQREKIVRMANQLARSHGKPKTIFKELTKHIERGKWVLPSYTVMQDLVGNAMSGEQSRLGRKINCLLVI